ncbi:glycine--tRNA ligase subunit beta [Gilliamella sp. B3791]|nr:MULTISPECIES: glycine--tRNA ligase subunit beta [unclassified Gilliamella]MCX8643001.1 glycine--tRNA ligase subunit beta [Gilliamella sp. B3835]MCX8708392.1 glycine--tRNA ligase subunit beta [Gilliamella sp. B3783]MCX8709874.1 glycine--tRNA ligase subunit beta [Gilliamella sp. B3780]MCX8712912.1 glycine--tRNA ligase subunit beta [Gilliamella sp. B3468]MCX8717588.1 glycine--tRNA ligase subunit beta [Gilliamella sp. B3784]
MQKTFLVEIGTEELPPKSLRTLAESFAANFIEQLDNAKLEHGEVLWYASPRRLALKVLNLNDTQPDSQIVKRGPAVSAAFDANGKPTKAAEGWARGCGITVDQAERIQTDKGEWLSYTQNQKGQPVVNLLCDMVKGALSKLPIPKPMRWAARQVEFIRPSHTVTMLYGDELVPGTILDIESNRIIRGHRFMGEQEFTIDNADQYPEMLEQRGKVIADYDKRKSIIKQQAEQAAAKLNGKADLTESLLEEVSSLVEWPVVLTAKFEERFLDVPAESLVYTMKGDQKYFPVYDKQGKLLPNFIFVANIESKDPQVVISGNEKVVRPRLADAEFFYKTDLKQRLEDRLPRLETVLFQQQLGTVKDKSLRIESLAGFIADKIGANVEQAKRAGKLTKCDLVTNTVFEFPETQGIMGRYLALKDGESIEVATAIEEQYKPRFAGDELPSTNVSSAVSIAEKMDTLAGIFGIGQHPKGDKDPFALRRAAIGILRIIVENNLPLDLVELSNFAVSLYGDKLNNKQVVEDIVSFMQGRFRAWYQEQGFTIDTIQAVLALNPTKPADFDARIKAVTHFRTLPEASSLAEANKRVSNILSKTELVIPDAVNASLLEAGAEGELAMQVAVLTDKLAPYFTQGRYQQALVELSALKAPVDAFFASTMVMADDEKIKLNRLALLKKLQNLFLKVADISLLQS